MWAIIIHVHQSSKRLKTFFCRCDRFQSYRRWEDNCFQLDQSKVYTQYYIASFLSEENFQFSVLLAFFFCRNRLSAVFFCKNTMLAIFFYRNTLLRVFFCKNILLVVFWRNALLVVFANFFSRNKLLAIFLLFIITWILLKPTACNILTECYFLCESYIS